MNVSKADDEFEHQEKALSEHKRMARLFTENRFQFELDRKKAIEQAINRSSDAGVRQRLRQLQRKWDTTLKHAGSRHNRFVLIQMIFWDHVNNRFMPALDSLTAIEAEF